MIAGWKFLGDDLCSIVYNGFSISGGFENTIIFWQTEDFLLSGLFIFALYDYGEVTFNLLGFGIFTGSHLNS